MSAFVDVAENRYQLKARANKSFALLFLLSVIISGSNFLLYLPFKLGLFQMLNASVVVVCLIFWFIAVKNTFTVLVKICSSLTFILMFSAWLYLDLKNAALSDMLFLFGMSMLLVWHSMQYKHAVWISAVVLTGSLVVLKLLSTTHLNTLVVYFLLFLFSSLLGVYAFRQKPRSGYESLGELFYPDEASRRPEEIIEPVAEEEIEPEPTDEVPLVNMTSHSAAYDWESVLRELHSELKTLHDVDNLFKSMLIFLSGAIEIDAAAVGMVQGGSIKKIADYGPEDLLHKKTLNWDSQRLKQLFNTQKELVSQQNHLNESNKQEKLLRLDIPVISNDKPVGLVSLFRRELVFDEYDTKLASGIVFHSMVALRQARMQEEIRRLSAGSSVNKTLLSREQFVEKAKVELEQLNKPKVFSLLIIEIDNFDNMEKRDGHTVIQKYYKQVASTILNLLHEKDELGRYGKEGFIVLLHEKELLAAKTLAEQIRKKISTIKCKTRDGVTSSTASIGLTSVSEQGEDMASLIRKADMGLFVAKESGFNSVKVSL